MKQKQIKILVEKHQEGYVAYPLGRKGVVVGEGARMRKRSQMQNPLSNFTLKPLETKGVCKNRKRVYNFGA